MQGDTILHSLDTLPPASLCEALRAGDTFDTLDTYTPMTSYLIIAKDKNLLLAEVEKICGQSAVHMLDRTVINKPDDSKPDKGRKTTRSIGIEDVKKMRQQIFLKPFKGKIKAVIFEDGELLTPEAQNALLKVMEEPPIHTIILLTAKNKDAILLTIQSRCHIIELQDSKRSEGKSDEGTVKFLENLKDMNIKTALELAEYYDKTKEELPEKLEGTIISIHTNMLQSTDNLEVRRLAGAIKILQNALTTVTSTNANKRLTIESALLSLSK
jgi:DNA polymerase III delta prime subunit